MTGLLSAKQLNRIVNHEDARSQAKAILPKALFDYVDHGSEDELTLAANIRAFHELQFRPRVAIANPSPELKTTIFGTEIAMPILTAPCGGMRLLNPDGDVGVARAAASARTIHIAAAGSGFTLEEISLDDGPKWFQLYRLVNQEVTESLVQRAQRAGYEALVITVDSVASGNREHDRRNGYSSDVFRVNWRNAIRVGPQVALRPSWFYRYWRDGMPSILINTAQYTEQGKGLSLTAMGGVGRDSHSPSWEEIVRIRDIWNGPLLLKGLVTADDALRAAEIGANGVIVSNHGGRQLDGAPATIEALPEVVAAVGNSLEVLMDSGIRRGTDVLKALALGAKAVLVGRNVAWGLAIGGQAGVERMLDILRVEMIRTMRLVGCTSIVDLDPGWLFFRERPTK